MRIRPYSVSPTLDACTQELIYQELRYLRDVSKNLVVIVLDTLRVPEKIPGFVWQRHAPFLHGLTRSMTEIPGLCATAPWTIPSHLSLLTGMDPWQVRLDERLSYTFPSLPSVADKWRQFGGDSAAFSANPVASQRNGTLGGFDVYNPSRFDTIAGSTVVASSVLDEHVLGPSFRRSNHSGWGSGLWERGGKFFAYGCVHALDRFWRYPRMENHLDSFLSRRDPRIPLHLFLNLMEMHEPYLLPPSEYYQQAEYGIGSTFSLSTLSRRWSRPVPGQERLSGRYLAALSALDRRLEGIVRLLSKRRVLDSASLVLVSDHGQSLGENGFVGHGHFLFDDLVRIPGFVGEFKDGRPTPLNIELSQPVDLRHIHDLLLSVSESTDPLELADAMAKSVSHRGRPAAYWEMIPRSGVFVKRARGPKSRSLRIFSTNGNITFSQNGREIPVVASVEGELPPSEAAEIEAEAKTTFSEIARADALAINRSQIADEVKARLNSWGYVD
jgi:hypothetical protein